MRAFTTLAVLLLTPLAAPADGKAFRAGAAAVDVTPTTFPVIVNGMFDERTAAKATDPLHARAQVGWAVVQAPEHTHNRRWIRRPDKMLTDPFGQRNVRANMHPGHQSPDAIGPSGPVDAGLSVLAVRTPAGKPVAVLANYSMHYVGSTPVS